MRQTPLHEIPKPPRGIGISRRLRYTLFALAIFILVFVLYSINHYTPKPMNFKTTTESKTVDRSSSEMKVQTISQAAPPEAIVVSHTKRDGQTVALEAGASQAVNQFSAKELSAIGEGGINIYSNEQTNSTSSQGASGYVSRSQSYPSMPAGPMQVGAYKAQNQQSEKSQFLANNARSKSNVIQAQLQKQLTPYEIKAGTIIPATLLTGIQSDLPGTVIAKVRSNVFDTTSGNYLLIPQGTTLIGTYDSKVAYGQKRVLMVWSRLIFPNGSSIDLQGMPGADLSGMAGMQDKVNNHYFRVFSSAALMSVFGALGQLSQPQNNSQQLTSQQIIYGAIGQQMGQTATQMIAKNMNIQPTLEIRQGAKFNVLLTRDLILPSAYQF